MEWWQILLIVLGSVLLLFTLTIIFYRQFFKRFWDFVLSLIAIIVLSPLLLILTIVGAIAMRGNPFFVQKRPGKNEKIFNLIKFRSMSNKKDKDGNLLPDEQRLGKYGKILRSTSLDELPELLNVVLGSLSLVGPRPLLIKDLVFMNQDQRKRHNVRQGITGLAQVSGRNNITWEQKFEYDLKYIKHISFFRDIKILLLTVLKVLKRDDVNREGTVSDLDFGDWLLKEGKINKTIYSLKMNQIEGK
ncbi:MAG: sugar transferase [Clostridia bacterium]|nr:sugar transferase [Clostridia bacterium]